MLANVNATARSQALFASDTQIAQGQAALDAWVRELMAWHFDPQTGTPFWLEFMENAGWDPREEVTCFAELSRFGLFQDEWLRTTPLEKWAPQGYQGRPYRVFETGGTTGPPKQRLDWYDLHSDYELLSETLDPEIFPLKGNWLQLGPTGPRRLRLGIEHLANVRGGVCFMIDLDPRWVVKLLGKGQTEIARQYMDHCLDQAVTLLKNRPVDCLFTTPRLLEGICERLSLREYGVKGVLCGGTSITPQVHRFLVEELLEGVPFVPIFGNTLMGLAPSKPFVPDDQFSITYHPLQPRAVLQVVDPQARDLVPYGSWGRVQLSTLTKDFFMPNFLERDEAMRTRPLSLYPWDGVRDVRPFGGMERKIVEGVY